MRINAAVAVERSRGIRSEADTPEQPKLKSDATVLKSDANPAENQLQLDTTSSRSWLRNWGRRDTSRPVA